MIPVDDDISEIIHARGRKWTVYRAIIAGLYTEHSGHRLDSSVVSVESAVRVISTPSIWNLDAWWEDKDGNPL